MVRTVGQPKSDMYPTLFRVGDFEVTSFGVLVAIAALVGIWLFSRELARHGLPADAWNAGVLAPDSFCSVDTRCR